MNPLEALSQSKDKGSAATAAPAAAAWLQNPNALDKRKTFAQLLLEDLEQNGEWKGPDYGTPENPAHD